MDDVKCPRCGSPLRIEDWGAGISALCAGCLWQGRRFPSREKAVAELSHLSWFEPRNRLPTEAEEAAHRARHGDGAGWMVRWVDALSDRHWFSGHDLGMGLDLAALRRIGRPCESYPHVDGRPVAWPEVSHE